MKLGLAASAAGHGLTVYEQIGSTNAAALESAGLGAPHWFVAKEQLAGRGRQGRSWSSPPGNLYATLLLEEPCPPRDAAKLGFLAGVALHEAVCAIAPELAALALKWPNDLLLGGAKIAGILLEGGSISCATGPRFRVAIGMGVNLAHAPADTPYPATSLAAEGCPITPATLLAELSDRFAVWLPIFARGEGFPALRDAWTARASACGTPIRVRLPEGAVEGVFAGLDTDGALLIGETGQPFGAPKRIAAGDVYFLGPSALGAPDAR